MVDANKMVQDILKNIDGATITFYHPNEFKSLPIISYYELTTTTGFAYDNAEQAQTTSVQVDIWGSGGGECSRLAIKVNTLMQDNGWYRELSRDMPPEDGIYHKTMRFNKQLYF